MVRLVREAKEGVFVRNKLLQFMWLDVDKRTRKLGVRTVYTIVHTRFLSFSFKMSHLAEYVLPLRIK